MKKAKKTSARDDAFEDAVNPEQEIAQIKKTLKQFTTLKTVKYWLDTGNEYLNRIFGSKELGIPYGKIFELSGNESNGKTALVKKLAGLAQRDGAKVGIIMLEDSWDEDWAAKLGLKPEQVFVFRPEVGTFGKETEIRMTTAEELFEQAKMWIYRMHKKNPDGRIFLAIDSIAAILTEEEAAAGIQNQNMRTKVSTATFMSQLLKSWVAIATTMNVMMIFVNQLRLAPGAWGNPEYTPGGKAIRFFASVRVKMSRKGKPILKDGKPVGLKGVLTNWKNKAGGGSREGAKAGYKLYFKGAFKFVDADEIKSEAGE